MEKKQNGKLVKEKEREENFRMKETPKPSNCECLTVKDTIKQRDPKGCQIG